MSRILYGKIAKGLVSLATIIILLSSILATSVYYNNNITANAVKEVSLDSETGISIIEVDEIGELVFLNEGWYQIRNGFVFYLDTFNSYAPLYIKILNQEQQNGLLAIDEYGAMEFGTVVNLLREKEIVDEEETVGESSQITGEVTGSESVTGFAPQQTKTKALPVYVNPVHYAIIKNTIEKNKLKITPEQVYALCTAEACARAANVQIQAPEYRGRVSDLKPETLDLADKEKKRISQAYNIPESAINVEYRKGKTTSVVSVSGGEMQLNEKYYSPEQLRDTAKNLEAGARTLNELYIKCSENYACAVRAYNQGDTALDQAKKIGTLDRYIGAAESVLGGVIPEGFRSHTVRLITVSEKYLAELTGEEGQSIIDKVGSIIKPKEAEAKTPTAASPALEGVPAGNVVYLNGIPYGLQNIDSANNQYILYSLTDQNNQRATILKVPFGDARLSREPPTFSNADTFASSKFAKAGESYNIDKNGNVIDSKNNIVAQFTGDALKNAGKTLEVFFDLTKEQAGNVILYTTKEKPNDVTVATAVSGVESAPINLQKELAPSPTTDFLWWKFNDYYFWGSKYDYDAFVRSRNYIRSGLDAVEILDAAPELEANHAIIDLTMPKNGGIKSIAFSQWVTRHQQILTPAPVPQVPVPTVEEWKKEVDKQQPWTEQNLKENFGDYYIDDEGYVWAADVFGVFIVATADQALLNKYKGQIIQVDLQGNIKSPAIAQAPSPPPAIVAAPTLGSLTEDETQGRAEPEGDISLPPRTEDPRNKIFEDLKTKGATLEQISALRLHMTAGEQAEITSDGNIIRTIISSKGENTGALSVYNTKGENIAFIAPEGDIFENSAATNKEEVKAILSKAAAIVPEQIKRTLAEQQAPAAPVIATPPAAKAEGAEGPREPVVPAPAPSTTYTIGTKLQDVRGYWEKEKEGWRRYRSDGTEQGSWHGGEEPPLLNNFDGSYWLKEEKGWKLFNKDGTETGRFWDKDEQPPITEKKPESAWDRLRVWASSLFGGEQKPAEPEPTQKEPVAPPADTSQASSIPLEQRRIESAKQIKELEERYENEIRRGADRNDLIPLEIEIGRLKNTAPPSPELEKLAEAGGIDLNELQKRFNVKEITVQDISDELMYNKPLKEGYEYRINYETKEPQIYAIGAEEPVHDSARPNLFRDAKPVSAPALTPAPSSVAPAAISAPSPPQGTAAVVNYYHDEKTGQIYAITLGKDSDPDFYYEFNRRTRTWEVLDTTSGEIDKITNPANDNIRIKNLNEVQTIIQTQKAPAVTEPTSAPASPSPSIREPSGERILEIDEEDIREASTLPETPAIVAQLPEAPRRPDGSLDVDAIGALYAQAQGRLPTTTSPIKNIHVDIPVQSWYNWGPDENYRRETDPRSGKVEYSDETGQKRSLLDTYNHLLQNYGNKLRGVEIEYDDGSKRTLTLDQFKKETEYARAAQSLCCNIVKDSKTGSIKIGDRPLSPNDIVFDQLGNRYNVKDLKPEQIANTKFTSAPVIYDFRGKETPLAEGSKYYDSNNKEYTLRYDSKGYPYVIASDGTTEGWYTLGKPGQYRAGVSFSQGYTLQPKLAVAIETGFSAQDPNLKSYTVDYRYNGIQLHSNGQKDQAWVLIDEAFGGNIDPIGEVIRKQYSFAIDGKKVELGTKDNGQSWDIYDPSQVDANGNTKQDAEPLKVQPKSKLTFTEISAQAIPPKKPAPAPKAVPPAVPPKIQTGEELIQQAVKFNQDTKESKVANTVPILNNLGVPQDIVNKLGQAGSTTNPREAAELVMSLQASLGLSPNGKVDQTLLDKLQSLQTLKASIEGEDYVYLYDAAKGTGVLIGTVTSDDKTSKRTEILGELPKIDFDTWRTAEAARLATIDKAQRKVTAPPSSIPTPPKPADEDVASRLISSLKLHGPISREAKDPTAKEESKKQVENTGDVLARLIWSESITSKQFDDLAKKQGLSDSEKAEVTTRVEAAKYLTSEYGKARENQINPYGGDPNEWKLDRFGNFICAKDWCYFSDAEIRPYRRGETFAPSGGDPSGRNWDANRDALVKLQGAPPPLPLLEADQLATLKEFEAYQKKLGASTALPEGTKRVDYKDDTVYVDNKAIDANTLVLQDYFVFKTGNEIYLATKNNKDIGYEAKALKISSTDAMLYSEDYPEQFVIVKLKDVPQGIHITEIGAAVPSAPAPTISTASTFNPQGQPTGALGVVRPQQVVGGAPAAGTPFRREQPSQQIQQHLVQVGDKQYNVVTISKNQDGSYEVAVNEMGIPNDPNDPTKGSKQLGKQIAPSVKIPPEMIPKDIQSNQWGNDPKIIPLAGNGQRVWNVESDGTLRATDTYTSYNPATKQSIVTQDRIVIVPPDKSYSIETTSTYDKTGKVASSTQEYKETPIGSIGSKRTITALPGMRVTEANGQLIKENIKSVTVENLDGKKTEIAPKAFRDASDKIGSDRDSLFFFSEIANRRIGNVQAVQIEEGKVVVGDKNNRVEWVRGETGGIIAAYEGANLVGYINPDPKVGTYFSLREGKAELKDGAPVLSDGAVAHIRQIVNRQVVSDMIEQQVKDTKISLETKDRAETGTMTVSITKGSETPTTFTIASSDIKGYLEARQIGGETYYIGTGENIDLPFGLGGGEIYKKDANGKLVRADNAESIAVRNILNKERESRGQPTFEQVSSQRFFANLERAYTEFQGLGYYATLFFDDDSLLKWRNNVDRLFATLYLGTEYWSSTICGEYLDGEDDGIAYAETPQGLSQVAAHIEATRTEPILTPTGQEFIYKITFNVRNGDYDKDPNAPEEMHVNVVLRGERTVAIFKQEQKVKRGSSFGRIGRNAIAQDSTAFYNEICLTFDQTPLKWKTSNGEICNTIVESSGAPSTVATTATSTTASSGGGAAEGDVNDF